MIKSKYPKVSGKNEKSLVRSSAAEYLTFAAASGTGGVEAVYVDENIWLTQKMIGVLYDVGTHTINYHLEKIFADSELQENAVIRNFRITAADGKSYSTKHYNLAAIIAIFSAKRPKRVAASIHKCRPRTGSACLATFNIFSRQIKLFCVAKQDFMPYNLTHA